MRVISVSLGQRSYDIQIGTGLLSKLGHSCQKLGLAGRCAVITDSHVAGLHADAVLNSLRGAGFDPVCPVVPAGETTKNPREAHRCWETLAAHRLERRSFVVAVGGGVVGDLAGFVAASYLRGIPFVQVPTTLLAQVDSSVGGKVGVNLKAGKNLVGAFHQPKLVVCDLATLNTLPDREYRSGLAEIIKYGVIYDAPLFGRLERQMDALLARKPAALSAAIARSCEIKADVVGQDETESGLRAILNFGHTVGHGLEAISHYGTYLHGEAISIGQVAAARLSTQLLQFPADQGRRIEALLARAGLPVSVKLTRAQRLKLSQAMRLDKKVSGGEIKFVLARKLGSVIWGQKVPETTLNATLDSLQP